MTDSEQLNIEELQTEFIQALNLLKESAELFRRYERNHRDKAKDAHGSSDISSHIAKADVNKDIAERIEAFMVKGMNNQPDPSLIVA